MECGNFFQLPAVELVPSRPRSELKTTETKWLNSCLSDPVPPQILLSELSGCVGPPASGSLSLHFMFFWGHFRSSILFHSIPDRSPYIRTSPARPPFFFFLVSRQLLYSWCVSRLRAHPEVVWSHSRTDLLGDRTVRNHFDLNCCG